MNGWAEYEIGRQHHEEIQHEVATARLEKLAHATREPRPEVGGRVDGWAECENGRQPHEEIQHEVATARLEKLAHANREPRPYVVRDLSWELARYLDTEGFSASASATSRSGERLR